MLATGVICLVVAGLALYVFFKRRSVLIAAQRAETFTCGELSEFATAVADVVDASSFVKVCEVKGVARAGDAGPLTAPESKQPCVWHKVVLTEHYWDSKTDSKGNTRRERETREISSVTSEVAFAVDDGTGTILVDPRSAEIDGGGAGRRPLRTGRRPGLRISRVRRGIHVE